MSLADILSLKNNGQVASIVYKYSINPNHVFANTTARDTYFTSNPTQKTEGVFISVGATFQRWESSAWVTKTPVLQGMPGTNGTNGTNGSNGADGQSAYEIAVANGFVGTEAEWLASLKGADGTGFTGTIDFADWTYTEGTWTEDTTAKTLTSATGSTDPVAFHSGKYCDTKTSAVISNVNAGYAGIVFRRTSDTDYLYALIVYGATSTVQLRKKVAGVESTVASANLTGDGVLNHTSTPMAIEAEVAGDRIKVYVNNVLMINSKSSDYNSFPRGESGLISDKSNAHVFNYFNVQELIFNNFNPAMTKILCLGSSITLGYGATINYPAQLKTKLDASYLKSASTITNAGVAYSTSADYISRLPTLMTTNTPEVVIIEASVNDFHTGAFVALDTCVANLRSLIKYVKGEGAMPVVCTMTPIDPTKNDEYWTNDSWHNIYQFNLKCREMVKDEKVKLIDMANTFSCNLTLLSDGVHPNDTGVQLYCDTVYANLLKNDGLNGGYGTNGNDGADGGTIPAGGATGQILMKSSSTDNDVAWSNLLNEITTYATVTASSNIFTIDLANRPIKNVKMTTGDTTGKTVALQNTPTQCELFIELTYTNAAPMTWFSGITWLSGSAPSLTAGKTYRLAFFTSNGGTAWHGNCVGGW